MDRSWIPPAWQHCPILGFESRTSLSFASAIRLEWGDGRKVELDSVCVLNPVVSTSEGLPAIAIPHEEDGIRVQVRLGPIPRPYIVEWWVRGGRSERVILSEAPVIVWEYADVECRTHRCRSGYPSGQRQGHPPQASPPTSVDCGCITARWGGFGVFRTQGESGDPNIGQPIAVLGRRLPNYVRPMGRIFLCGGHLMRSHRQIGHRVQKPDAFSREDTPPHQSNCGC